MNELTQKIQRILTPKAALIAYRCDECRTNSTEYFLELRPIHKNGQMGAGMPVTYEFMNALMESYTEEMSGIPAGVLPENLLACNPRKGQEAIYLVQPAGQKTDVLPQAAEHPGRCVPCAGHHLPHPQRADGRLCLQGKEADRKDTSVPGPFLQCDGFQRMSGFLFVGKAAEPVLSFPDGILGEAILADGIRPSGRQTKSYRVESGHGDRKCEKPTF